MSYDPAQKNKDTKGAGNWSQPVAQSKLEMVDIPFKQIEAQKVAGNEMKKGLIPVKNVVAKKRNGSKSPNSPMNNRDAPAPSKNDATRHKVHKSLCAIPENSAKRAVNKITMADLDVTKSAGNKDLPEGLTET